MLGHDGLFARRFPIGCTGLMPSDLIGVYQRRFDLFAIVGVLRNLLVWILLVVNTSTWIGCLYLGCSFDQPKFVRFVVSSIVQHRPRHARRLVGQRHRNNVGMTSLQQLIDPPT